MGGSREWIRGSLLGVGAFGQVNLAMDRVTGSLFAVKSTVVCSSSSSSSSNPQWNSSLAAMENEIRMLQSLESEHVVRCLGSDWSEEEGGQRMRNMFLEYMPGGSLSDLLKQFAGAQPLDEELIRSYTRSLVQGIDYLHCRGIVHCDIKAKNVLVGNAPGCVKLADFGSAKHVDAVELRKKEEKLETEDLDLEDCVMRKVNGTPLWMAPEVVLQQEQGLPSDIWSLGCTVVEMATGRAPWAQITDPFVALYRIGCTDEMPAVPASLSPEAHDFLARCFERNPRRRWTSAQLLEHPFLTAAAARPPSPPSVMRNPGFFTFKSPPVCSSPSSVLPSLDDDGSNSMVLSSIPTNSSSIPPLSSPRLWKLAEFQFPKPADCNKSSKDRWRTSTPLLPPVSEGDWIVVRSPKGSSPSHSKFESSHEHSEMQSEHNTSTTVAVGSGADSELQLILGYCSSSMSTSAPQESSTKHHHIIQELCKSPPVAPLMMEDMQRASLSQPPLCFTSSFTSSSSSLSSFPRASRGCSAEAEKLLPFPGASSCSIISKGMSTTSTGIFLLKPRHSNHAVQIPETQPISVVAHFLQNPVKDYLQFHGINNHLKEFCRKNYFLGWLDKVKRASSRFEHFRTSPWISLGKIHKHLLRRFGISLLENQYLCQGWFSSAAYKHFQRLIIQGLLLGLSCNVQLIASKQLVAIHLKLSLSNLYFWGETYFVLRAVSGISLSCAPDIVIAIKLELLELGFGGSMSTKTQLQEFNSSSFQFLYILLSNASVVLRIIFLHCFILLEQV